MKTYTRITLITLLACCVSYFSKSQTILNTSEKLRMEIEAANSDIEKYYMSRDVNALLNLYDTALTFFADYKPAIFESQTLKRFFTDWFKVAPLTAYKKKIHTVEVYVDHILEIGSFSAGYSSIHKSRGQYNGKYMILWKKNSQGTLRIVSETIGADTYVEPDAIPFADAQVTESSFPRVDEQLNKQLLNEVRAFDDVLLKAVAEGDGDTRAKGFAEDAILLAQFDSIRVGMSAIRPKILSTYRPGSTYIVKHRYSRIIDLGNYIFVNGHYKGGPADPKNGGPFEGKISNLLKRTEDGKLLMYRQSGNRDKKQY